jgi:hypothetical protein
MLSDEEKRRIRSIVREIASVVDRLARTAVNDPAREGSVARSHAVSALNLPSFDGIQGIVQEANFSMLLATSAGVDHIKVFTSALIAGHGTVALGTLVRGAVEAFAKSYFLLTAQTTADLIGRHIALTTDELKFPVRYSQFQQWDGRVTDGKGYLDVHRNILLQLGLEPLRVPSVQNRVSALLTAGSVGPAVGGDVYSGLSGAAHAVTSALGMYLQRDDSAKYEYPREIGFEQVGYLFASIVVVAGLIIDVFALEQADRDRWDAARTRAEIAIVPIIQAAAAAAAADE